MARQKSPMTLFIPCGAVLFSPDRKNEHKEGPPGSPEFVRRLRNRKSGDGVLGGRWSLLRGRFSSSSLTATEWSANTAQQLLTRYGIVMRETAIAENIPGGYNTVYPALRIMEESGFIRRGMFVAGLGAAQFAMPSAVEMLRSLRTDPPEPESVVLAASDPANPYGSLLPWTRNEVPAEAPGEIPAPGKSSSHSMARASGASVILVNGQLAAFVRRKNPFIKVFLPDAEPERSHVAARLALQLAELALKRQASRRSGLLIAQISDILARQHFLARYLEEAGFSDRAGGYYLRRVVGAPKPVIETDDEEEFAEDINAPETV